MRVLHMTHPDQVDDLPLHFHQWVLAYDAVERQARSENEKAEIEAARG